MWLQKECDAKIWTVSTKPIETLQLNHIFGIQ